MRTHVGQPATGVFAIIAPRREVVVDAERAENLIERARGRRPVPQIPVDTIGSLLVAEVARPGRAADADAYGANRADAAAAHILDGFAEMAAELGSLLAAGLEDDVVVACRRHHRASLGNGQRQRLLAIDVLARPRRQHRRDVMPVVRRRDDDGVDVAAIEQLAKIDKRGAAAIRTRLAFRRIRPMHALDGILAPLPMDIADRNDLHAAIAEKALQVPASHHADADEAEIDTAVGPLPLARLLRGRLLGT